MADIKLERDMNIVKLLTAQAMNKPVDSDKAQEAADKIKELTADLNPQNRYMIAQLVAFGVEGLQKQVPTFLTQIADYKTVGEGDKASFSVPVGGIKAVIQAKGATTLRSKIAEKNVIVNTVAVSARPSVNLVELRAGTKNMADLIRMAYTEIEMKKLGYVQKVLHDAISGYASPFYGTGAGVIQTTLDPMLLHFRRTGGAVMLGDYAVMDKVAALTGFTDSSTTTFADSIIEGYHQSGIIGSYRGARVLPMLNAYEADGVTPILDPSYIYMMSLAGSPDQRSLKVVNEGAPFSVEHTDIDDLSYDVRIDQHFGAAFVVGSVPTLGVYEDSTL